MENRFFQNVRENYTLADWGVSGGGGVVLGL